MKKIVIAVALAATALTATSASAQYVVAPGPASFTLTTPLTGSGVPASPTPAILSGTVTSYASLINGLQTPVTGFNVSLNGVDYNTFNNGVTASFGSSNGSDGSLAFFNGLENIFSFTLSGLYSANNLGATPSGGNTVTQATSFTYNGGTIAIDAGSTGTLAFSQAAVAAVPEPATWGMMLAGFGAMGGAMRRRAKVRTNVSFA